MSKIIQPKLIITIELDNLTANPTARYMINQDLAYPALVIILSQVLAQASQTIMKQFSGPAIVEAPPVKN